MFNDVLLRPISISERFYCCAARCMEFRAACKQKVQDASPVCPMLSGRHTAPVNHNFRQDSAQRFAEPRHGSSLVQCQSQLHQDIFIKINRYRR